MLALCAKSLLREEKARGHPSFSPQKEAERRARPSELFRASERAKQALSNEGWARLSAPHVWISAAAWCTRPRAAKKTRPLGAHGVILQRKRVELVRLWPSEGVFFANIPTRAVFFASGPQQTNPGRFLCKRASTDQPGPFSSRAAQPATRTRRRSYLQASTNAFHSAKSASQLYHVYSGCHWTPRTKRLFGISMPSGTPSSERAFEISPRPKRSTQQ